tara:strand:- start:22967 stop:23680 length:714 start_codon:yes stop_codon:yes gene_type:complete
MERYSINKVKGKDINISMPPSTSFTQLGLTETIDELVAIETNNSLNPFSDGERIAYKSSDPGGININFRFLNRNTNTYEQDYSAAGFNTVTGLTKNSFTKSYFRLYFYDENSPENRNLMSFEDLDAIGTKQPTFNLKRIFWDRNYELFNKTNDNKNLYIIGRFFSALNGKVYDFYNLPLSYTAPINITQYSQNGGYWTSPIMVINPKINNGEHNFAILAFSGANTTDTITLTERVIL